MPCAARGVRARPARLRTPPGAGARRSRLRRRRYGDPALRLGAQTSVHFHTLVAEGVLATAPDGAVSRAGPRHAHREGSTCTAHAAAAVRTGDRRRLSGSAVTCCGPPLAQDALELSAEGQVVLRLRRPWRDGTRAIRFAPTELLEKLAALVPRPRANRLLYHGALAAGGCWRVVPQNPLDHLRIKAILAACSSRISRHALT